MNPNVYRSLFPILDTHTHLASCSQGALEKSVSKAITEYHNELIFMGSNWNEAMNKSELARGKFAELIGAETDEVANVGSVSDVLSTIATSLPLHPQKKHCFYKYRFSNCRPYLVCTRTF